MVSSEWLFCWEFKGREKRGEREREVRVVSFVQYCTSQLTTGSGGDWDYQEDY